MTDQLDVEALVGRLREEPRGAAHSYPTIVHNAHCRHVVPYGNMMNAAADVIESLLAHIAGESARVAEAIAAERERAAMIAVAFGDPLADWDDDIAAYETAQLIAAAIRKTPNAE